MAWQKGQSGNPKGPPKRNLVNGKSLRELAREFTPQALETLANVMLDGESDAARVSAANSILDRGWGKPTQPIGGDDDAPPIRTQSLADAPDDVLRYLAAKVVVESTDANIH